MRAEGLVKDAMQQQLQLVSLTDARDARESARSSSLSLPLLLVCLPLDTLTLTFAGGERQADGTTRPSEIGCSSCTSSRHLRRTTRQLIPRGSAAVEAAAAADDASRVPSKMQSSRHSFSEKRRRHPPSRHGARVHGLLQQSAACFGIGSEKSSQEVLR